MTAASRPVAEALFVELLQRHAEFHEPVDNPQSVAQIVMTMSEQTIQSVAYASWMAAQIFEEVASGPYGKGND